MYSSPNRFQTREPYFLSLKPLKRGSGLEIVHEPQLAEAWTNNFPHSLLATNLRFYSCEDGEGTTVKAKLSYNSHPVDICVMPSS